MRPSLENSWLRLFEQRTRSTMTRVSNFFCIRKGRSRRTPITTRPEESSPLLGQSGQHRFPSCSYDAIQKQHKKKKKKQYFADSCHHWKTNWAVGIKVRDRDYILLQEQNRRGWLEGKDSMIGRWLVHEGCMINGSTHIFRFFQKKEKWQRGLWWCLRIIWWYWHHRPDTGPTNLSVQTLGFVAHLLDGP